VPRFVRQALHDEPITVYGDGRQTRCFTDVHDAVRAMIGLMDAEETVGEVYNLGSTVETPIVELAERVKQLAESASPITFVPYSDAYGDNFEDMPRRVPSLDKIQAAIDWQPVIGLDEILRSVIEYEQSLTPQPA